MHLHNAEHDCIVCGASREEADEYQCPLAEDDEQFDDPERDDADAFELAHCLALRLHRAELP